VNKEMEQVFLPSEAIAYLKEKRGIIMSVANLRQRRKRGTAKAEHVGTRTSLWTKEELDAIQPSPRTRRVQSDE
jgi:hypothetical protein